MRVVNKEGGSLEIFGPITNADRLREAIPLSCKKLAILEQNLFSGKYAAPLRDLEELKDLWILCDAGRTAIRKLLQIPKLEALDVLGIRSPGRKMSSFESARNLKTFRCNLGMNRSDLLAISKSPSIEKLGAQNACLDASAVESIMMIPKLKSLDLECTNLDNDMATVISQSAQITALEIGASRVTNRGLTKICEMQQLKCLDVWALDISESDIGLIAKLKNLEYLSIGGYDKQEKLSASGVLPYLGEMPSLKRLWLDGIPVTDTQKHELEHKFEDVRITFVKD